MRSQRLSLTLKVDHSQKYDPNQPFFADEVSGTIFNLLTVNETQSACFCSFCDEFAAKIPFEGESFSQFEPLTVRITNILRQYPDGSQILKEILQNADDARARHVKFIFDKRKFAGKTTFSEGLGLFQGPSLFAYNSATFEEKDFESIRRLGKPTSDKFLRHFTRLY